MTDDYDVTTPEHLAWVKGLDYGAACEWRDSTDLPWVKGNVMNPPACALRPELIRPTAAERQRMALERVAAATKTTLREVPAYLATLPTSTARDVAAYDLLHGEVSGTAKLRTALDALQIAHDEWKAKFDSERHHAISLSNANRDLMSQRDEWRDRALRAEALVQRMEAPSIRIPKVTPNATMKIGPAFHPITGAKFVHDGNGWHYEEKPDDDRGRGLLTMAAVSKGVGR